MRIKINEETIKEIEELTITSYEYENGSIPVENVESILDDLLLEIKKLEKRLEELDHEPESGDPYDLLGLSINDFI